MIDSLEQVVASNRPARAGISKGIRTVSRWRWLNTAFKVSLGPAIVIWFLKSGRLDAALLAGALRNWPKLLLTVFILYSVSAVTSLRWCLFLRAQSIPIKLADCFSFTMAGMFLGLPTPGGAGGDVAKIWLVRERVPGKGKVAAETVLVDRMVGLFSLLAFVGAAMIASVRRKSVTPQFV